MFWRKAERRCATPNVRYSTKSAIEIQLNHRLTCVHHRLPTDPNHLKHKQTINFAPILPNHRNQKKIPYRNAQIHLQQSMFSTTEKYLNYKMLYQKELLKKETYKYTYAKQQT